MTASVAALFTVLTGSASLQSATYSATVPPVRPPLRPTHTCICPSNTLTHYHQQLRLDIAAQQPVVAQAEEFSASQRLLPSLISPSPLPTPVSLPTPIGSLPRTRTVDDLHDNSNDTERRLRPRIDAGPCPSPDDTQIHVDLVTCLISLMSPVHCSLSFTGHLVPSPSLLHLASPSLSHFPSRPPSGRPAILFLFLFLFLSFLSSLPSSLATIPSSHGLTFFSVNANGLHYVMKTNAIKQYVSTTLPHVN